MVSEYLGKFKGIVHDLLFFPRQHHRRNHHGVAAETGARFIQKGEGQERRYFLLFNVLAKSS